MISLIVAYSKNNKVIGVNNTIPWHIKEDFIHFKNYTTGKTIIMGEQTFLSIGKPLPNRKTIVATIKDFKYDHEDVTISNDLFEVLKEYTNKLGEEDFEIVKEWQLGVCERKDMQGLATHILTIYQKS